MIQYSEDAFRALLTSATDFDCLPPNYRVLEFSVFLLDQGNNEFTSEDIRLLFLKANLRNPGDLQIRKPSANQIDRILRKLIEAGKIRLVSSTDGGYRTA